MLRKKNTIMYIILLMFFSASTIVKVQSQDISIDNRESITNLFREFYDYEKEHVDIVEEEYTVIITLTYSDSLKNMKGKKILTLEVKEEKYQYYSYYSKIIIDPKNHRGMADSFAPERWYKIDPNQSTPLDKLIFDIYIILQK